MPSTVIPGPTPLTSSQVRGFWAAWGGRALDGMDSFIYLLDLLILPLGDETSGKALPA